MIEAAGTTEAWELALELVRPGGTVLAFGGLPREAHVRVDPFRIHYEEVTLQGRLPPHSAPRPGGAGLPRQRRLSVRAADHPPLRLEGVAGLLADPPRDYLKGAVVLAG